MDLDKWTHFAEITASIAVVASLIFLTLEIGDNTRAMERQSLRDRAKSKLNQQRKNLVGVFAL